MFFPWPGHGPQPSKDVAKPGDTTEFINASAGSETPRMGVNSGYRLGGEIPNGKSLEEIIGTDLKIMGTVRKPLEDNGESWW